MALFTNQATLTYNNTSVTSNLATGELLEVLSAVKTAVTETYNGSDPVTYVVSIVNSGAAAFTGLTVTDTLGAYTFGTQTLYPLTYVPDSLRYYVNGVLQTAPTVTAGPPLTVTGLTVPADSSALLIYEARPNGFAPLAEGSTVTNTAAITGGGLASPVTAEETVTAASQPELSITKAISPATVTENARVTYTFTLQNFGSAPLTAADVASVTDTFDPVLTDLAVTFENTLWTEGTEYTYDAASGLFTTVPGQILVPAASFTQDAATGAWTTTPGTAVLTVAGTI